MNEEVVSSLTFLSGGILAGLASSFLETSVATVISLTLAGLMVYSMKRLVGKEIKWFLGTNGLLTYVFFWIISWTIFLGM